MTSSCVKGIIQSGFRQLESSDDDKSSISSENNDEILPTVLPYLTPAMIEEARTQLNETEETRTKGLADLRKMIAAEKKLVSPTDDHFLLAFLRARKFNAKRAFKLLQNYWLFRKEYKKIYDYKDDESVKDLVLRSFLGLHQYRDRKGCAVIIFKMGFWDPDKDSYENMFLATSAVLVFGLEQVATQITGYRMIIDARGLSWKQLKYFTPGNLLLVVRSTQFCFPARYKGIHILSENKMIGFLWSMMYPLLTSKLKKRIFFLGEDLSPLTEHIHPSVLPVEFGGQGPCFDNSSWRDILDEQSLKLKEHLKNGYKD